MSFTPQLLFPYNLKSIASRLWDSDPTKVIVLITEETYRENLIVLNHEDDIYQILTGLKPLNLAIESERSMLFAALSEDKMQHYQIWGLSENLKSMLNSLLWNVMSRNNQEIVVAYYQLLSQNRSVTSEMLQSVISHNHHVSLCETLARGENSFDLFN